MNWSMNRPKFYKTEISIIISNLVFCSSFITWQVSFAIEKVCNSFVKWNVSVITGKICNICSNSTPQLSAFVFFVFVLWPIESTTTNGQGFKTYNKNFQKACFEDVSLVHSYYNILVLDKDVRLFSKLYWHFVNEYLLDFYWDRFLGRIDPYLNWPPFLIKLSLFLIKSITSFIWTCCGSPVLLKTPCSFFEL